ncbi:MAG: ATP-binding protein [Blautia sp.]|nr:ATP-binding protein [Blautia sp.]
MALQNHQYETIIREYNRKQAQNRYQLEQRIRKAYARIPRLPEIDREVAKLCADQIRVRLTGSPDESLNISDALLERKEERAALLLSEGFPPDYLEPSYHCPLCQDTGFKEGRKCICFRQAEIDLLYRQSALTDVLEEECFQHFSFDYYSDTITNETTGLTEKETARKAFDYARSFVSHFDSSFENLFLYGNTGVGKTFLSHCIAKELLDSAHSVLYFSAFDFFEAMAENTFDRKASADNNTFILDCDLLIIDDLGTELNNSFVSSSLFLCINERIMRKKSTVISTNLTLEEFSRLYSERTFSRIASRYQLIKLIGNDIRIQKKLLGGN